MKKGRAMKKISKLSIKRMVALVLCLAMAAALCGCSMLDYKKAVKFYDIGAYQQAKELFDALGAHKDSAEYAAKAACILDYNRAVELYAGENYAEAAGLFEALGDYEKSAEYLSKCEDKLLAEKISGRWLSREVDMSGIIAGYMQQQFAAMGYGDISFDEVGSLGFKSYYSFEDFGLVRQQLEDESISKVLEAMARISKNLIIALTEQEIAAAAAEYGISVDEMYAAFGAGGVEDYLALSLGMSVDELLYMIYNEQTIKTLLSDTEVTGAWYVKDGILYVLTADETERGEYNAEKDIIVLTGTEYTGKVAEEFTDEEINSIYPIELIHAYKIEPTA